MKTAIGTKVIRFEPMSEEEFTIRKECMERGFGDERDMPVPVDEQCTPGYHVQYDNPDGSVYDSWSPKDVFESSYTDVSGDLDFGQAYFMMKYFGKKCRPECCSEEFYVYMKDGVMYCLKEEKFCPDDEELDAYWSIVDA